MKTAFAFALALFAGAGMGWGANDLWRSSDHAWHRKQVCNVSALRVGMSRDELKTVCDRPDDVKVYKQDGKSLEEQWIFGNPVAGADYIYVEDGVVIHWNMFGGERR